MKKIPTLFQRIYVGHEIQGIENKLTDPSLSWVLDGEGVATVKYDGSCCAIIDGKLYKRYDAKKGKTPPEGAIACCDPDPVTGHWPHWVECKEDDPNDKWFIKAYNDLKDSIKGDVKDGTYEAVGKHFNGNPYRMDSDILIKHGMCVIEVERNIDAIHDYLEENNYEGIVFWKDGEPKCKIKRTDFGFEWPI